MKDGILIGLIVALLIVLGIGWFQYSKLENEFQEVQIKQNEYLYKIDSLNNINNQNIYIIDSLSLNISNLKKEIISINKDKQELEYQLDKFEFKDNLEDNVILLRDNIWKYSH